MIHSARSTILPIVNIVFRWNLFCFEKWGRTDRRTNGSTNGRSTCAKTMITTGRDCGSASWINIPHHKDSHNLVLYLKKEKNAKAVKWLWLHSALKKANRRTISFTSLIHIFLLNKPLRHGWSLVPVIVWIGHISKFRQEKQQKFSDKNVLLLTHCGLVG